MLFKEMIRGLHNQLCACEDCFVNRRGIFNPRYQGGLISEHVIGLTLFKALGTLDDTQLPERMNTYERIYLMPFLNNASIARLVARYLPNCASFNAEPSTYDETLIACIVPILLERMPQCD